MSKTEYGRKWEKYAAEHLRSLGYKIITQNFYSRYGEIDIIAEEGTELVFVEVKARSSQKFGAPQEAVTPYKIKSIQKTLEYFILKNPKYEKSPIRIDVVAISTDYQPPKVEIFKNVF